MKEITDSKVWIDSGESLEEDHSTAGTATVQCRAGCGWAKQYERQSLEW